MDLTLSAIMVERMRTAESLLQETAKVAPAQAASTSGQQESHDPSAHIKNEDEQAEEGTCTVAVEAAAAAAEAERPSAGIEASPSPPAELAQLFELPDMWMKVAAFLGVPVLGLLACTASHLRAVLPKCVSISAASALHPVFFEEQSVTAHRMCLRGACCIVLFFLWGKSIANYRCIMHYASRESEQAR